MADVLPTSANVWPTYVYTIFIFIKLEQLKYGMAGIYIHTYRKNLASARPNYTSGLLTLYPYMQYYINL